MGTLTKRLIVTCRVSLLHETFSLSELLGLVQTSIFTCTEPNCNLGRLE